MIQKQLVDKLALKMLEGEFGEGDRVAVDADRRRAQLRAGCDLIVIQQGLRVARNNPN